IGVYYLSTNADAGTDMDPRLTALFSGDIWLLGRHLERRAAAEFRRKEDAVSKAKNPAQPVRGNDRDRGLREALATIAQVAGQALGDNGYSSRDHVDDENDHYHDSGDIGCAVKSLPDRLKQQAADLSTKINPVNAPAYWRRSAFAAGLMPEPQFIAALT